MTGAGATVAQPSAVKRLSAEANCLSLDVNITIPKEAFDPAVLVKIVGAEDFDLSTNALTGPLRLGGVRGKEDFSIRGTVELHETKPYPHYHISVQAANTDPMPVKASWPTAAEFFRTIAEGLSDPNAPRIRILGQHSYPREWWGGMELPQPLPFGTAENRSDADLTGLEVSYRGENGIERVLLSALEERFLVITFFTPATLVSEGFLVDTIKQSASIGERLFNQVAQKREP